MSTSLEDHNIAVLTQQIEALRREVRTNRRAAGLGNSAIDDGALTVKDVDGTTTMLVGQQYDGTATAATVGGPPPPQATTPIVTAAIGGAIVTWDGLYAAGPGVVAPMDFARVEVHADTDPAFDAEYAYSIVGTFESPRGGDLFVPLPLFDPMPEYTVKLMVRSQAGKVSSPSVGVQVTPMTPPPPGPTEAPAASPEFTVTALFQTLTVVTAPIGKYDSLIYEVATDAAFTQIVYSATAAQTSIQLAPLPHGVDLWVRVTATNSLGAAAPSAAQGPYRTILIESVDVANLTLTFQKFRTSTHLLY